MLPLTSKQVIASCGQEQDKATKEANLNKVLADYGRDKRLASEKTAQGTIGPIIMRLRYDGIVRSVLTEDPLAQGAGLYYDSATTMGNAYKLHPNGVEVKISMYEGVRVPYEVVRIAAFPVINEEDIYKLTINMVEYAQGEAEQRIMEQEDGYLFSNLDAAAEDVTVNNPDFAGLTSHISTVTGGITPAAFYNAEKIAILNRLESRTIIMNPATANDLYTWKLDTTGVKFLDDVMDGKPITKMGRYNIMTSILCPVDRMYMLPEARYLGWMPILKQLDAVDNPKAEVFQFGWVYSELINEIIVNSYGVVRLDLE